ncbi:PTS sugar transporter subunit IIA [Paenibacillus sp. NPDC058177]|uniref:PTS sugar transporter subunit IIA n=1 Tax=Paenibacillus sp. NPDC058177 TaxID=3346369 RepID=UPI0036DA51BF
MSEKTINGLIFDHDLIQLNARYDSKEELIKSFGKKIEEKQYAKQGYTESLLQRESEYPTGINMGTIGIAIPHTDKKFVNETTIGVAVLDHSVEFQDMGSDETVNAEIVMVLVVKNPKMHISFLKNLTRLFQEEEFINSFKNATKPSEIEAILLKLL